MSRIDDVLEFENLDAEAKAELKDAKQQVKDLEALASIASSNGGEQLMEMLRDDCRDILTQMINAKREAQIGWEQNIISSLLPTFEAKFMLYNTIKSAPADYEDANQQLEARAEEIIEGTTL